MGRKRGTRVVDGRVVRVRSPASAGNARATRKHVYQHGAEVKRLPLKLLDRRFSTTRELIADADTYMAHMGGDVSVVQRDLAQQAAYVRMFLKAAITEMQQRGIFDSTTGNLTGAAEAVLRLTKEQRELAKMLGLQRHTREVSLNDLLLQQQPVEKPE